MFCCRVLETTKKKAYYSDGLACCELSPSAAPTLSAVVCSPAVSSSLPCCLMLYSCSMAVSCWSSANDSANGTPKNRALVVMTQAALPLKERAVQAALETVLTLPETQPRVVGGMMSRRAYRRSARVSSMGSYSDSLEISESEWKISGQSFTLCLEAARVGDHHDCGKQGLTGISEVLVLLRAGLVGLEMLVLDLCESDHLGGLCGKDWKGEAKCRR